MKHLLQNTLLLAACLAVTSLAYGQFTLSGEIRPRAEFRDGFKTINTAASDPAFFIEQRSRLYFNYQEDRLQFHLALQDVRIWGGTSQIYKADNALTNLYEAWGEYQFSSRASVRVGRQALDYDNARFLGDLDWAQQGRSHDAVKFVYQDTSGWELHVGGAYNQGYDPPEPRRVAGTFYDVNGNYKTMQFAWLHKSWASASASLLILNDGRQRSDSTVAFRQTYGFVGNWSLGDVKLGNEIYYQGGKDPAGLDVSAWLLAANATFNTAVTPLTLGVDYLSGSDAQDQTNHAFNPLYGTNHKFYGLMDFFYVGNNHGQEGRTAGLVNFYAKAKFKLGEKSALITHVHHFQSPTAVQPGEGSGENLSSGLAQEIDLVYNLNISPTINFKLGYSHLFSTESLEALKGGAERQGANQWAWSMISFRPTFFSN